MLYKILFLITIFLSNVFGLCIIDENVKYDVCIKDIKYYIDEEKKLLDIDDNMYKNTNKSFLGYKKGIVWTKLDLKYEGFEDKEFILFNPKVSMDNIEVFVYKNNKLYKTDQLGDMINIKEKEIKTRYSAFSIDVKSGDNITIISKIKHKGAIEIAWLVLEQNVFELFIIKESIIIGLFVGILLAIILYHVLLYFIIKDNDYLYYILHAIFAIMFQIANTNLFYEFDLLLGGQFIWIVGLLSMSTLLILSKKILNIDDNFPKLKKGLNFVITITISFSIYFYVAKYYPSMMMYSKYILFFILISYFVIAILLVLACIRYKIKNSTYYIIGLLGYSICFLAPQISNVLAGELTILVMYLSVFGILFDVVFFSITLSNKIKNIKIAKDEKNKLLIAQAGYANIGKTIANIAHQWKTPIIHNSLLLTKIEANLYQKEIDDEKINQIIKDMRENISFISNTLEELNDIYAQHTEKESINIYNEVSKIVRFLKMDTHNSDINIEIDINSDILYLGYKNALLNVILILLDNSIYILKSEKIKNKYIKISVDNQDKLHLTIQDNANGIKIKPIEAIFDMYITTKSKSNGLGLYIAKSLVEQKLDGNISVENTKDGAKFTIII